MTIKEFEALALKHYEQGGDAVIECWDTEDKQAFLDKHGDNAEAEALDLFKLLHDHAEDIRGTAF